MNSLILRPTNDSILKLLENGDLEVDLPNLAASVGMPPTQENYARLAEIITKRLSDEGYPDIPVYLTRSNQ